MLVTVPAFVEAARAAVAGTGVQDIVVIGGRSRCLSLADVMGRRRRGGGGGGLGAPAGGQAPVDLARHVVVLPYSSGTTGRAQGGDAEPSQSRRQCRGRPHRDGRTSRPKGCGAVAFLPFFHIYGMTVRD